MSAHLPATSTEAVVVTIPAGMQPGHMLLVQAPSGQQVSVAVPAGCGAGAKLQVQVPVVAAMHVVMGVARADLNPVARVETVLKEGWADVSFGFFSGGSKRRYVRLYPGSFKCFDSPDSTFARDIVMLRYARWSRQSGRIKINSTLDQSVELKHKDPAEADAWTSAIEKEAASTNALGGNGMGSSITMMGAGF